jgi:hypothetical protein
MPPIVIIRKNDLFSTKFSKKRCHIRNDGLFQKKRTETNNGKHMKHEEEEEEEDSQSRPKDDQAI